MLATSINLDAIRHPLVSTLYMKKDFDSSSREKDVLVIETRFPDAKADRKGFDACLMDLLGDLEGLKNQVVHHVGHFDRVDIRTR